MVMMGCSNEGSDDAAASGDSNATVAVVPGIANWFVAQDQGLDKKYGFTLNIETAHVTAATLIPSLGKQYDFGVVTIPDVINAWASGLKPTIIAADSSETTTFPATYTVADKDISSIADLKGKAVAVIAESGTGYVGFLKELADAGLSASDVRFITTPAATMYDTLQSGRVQAAVMSTPPAYEAVADTENYRVLGKPSVEIGTNGTALKTVVVADSVWAAANPATVESFRKMFVESQEWINANVDGTKQIRISDMGNAEAALASSPDASIIDAILGLEPTIEQVTPWISAMNDLDLLTKSISAADLILPWPADLSAATPTADQLAGQSK